MHHLWRWEMTSLGWGCLSSLTVGTVPTLSSPVNTRHAHSQCPTSPCWADISQGSMHCFLSQLFFLLRNLLCWISIQPLFLLDQCFTRVAFLFLHFYPDHTIVIWSEILVDNIWLYRVFQICSGSLCLSWCDRLLLCLIIVIFGFCVSVFVYFLFTTSEI